MRVLVATDAFPPRCGGSGWSTYELARALRGRGHEVTVVQPTFARPPAAARRYDGFEVRPFPGWAPPVPFLRNYVRNERLAARLGRFLAAVTREHRIDLIHAQHELTIPAAARAGRQAGVPVVGTIRDYWPVCYWSDLIVEPDDARLCPRCSAAAMTRCLRPRAGRAWPLAVPFVPYMRANLAGKQRALARLDAVTAVSTTMLRDLRQRAAGLVPARTHLIPNMVDLDAIERRVTTMPRPHPDPYVVYIGKLAVNKGSDLLPEVVRRARIAWPLVVVGDGPARVPLERAFRAEGGPVRFTGWADRDETLAWLAHAAGVVFPSRGPESLSRVLLEASALGVPAAAMDTGGTADIVRHRETGLLSQTSDELAVHLRQLVSDPALRRRLGAASRAHVAARFAAPVVVTEVEALYRTLLARGRAS